MSFLSLKKPRSSHTRDISVVISRTIETIDAEDVRKEISMGTSGGKLRTGIELDPKPDDDEENPVNWSRWKKEAAYASLLLITATVCVLKTLYVTTNSVISTEYNCSYSAATAFTGLPFVVAAISSLGSNVLSQMIGKRVILLVSGFLMLFGVLWNMHVYSTYSWFMVSRVMQAVGWGATEGVVISAIRDIFLVHERGARQMVLNVVSLMFTWGSPILGGFLSQSPDSFRKQLMVLNIFQAFAVLFVILLVPETTFNCSESNEQLVADKGLPSTVTTVSATATAPLKAFMESLRPLKYTSPFSSHKALQSLRALAAPSTILAFLAAGPLVASAHGVANTLSLLFATIPTFLFPEILGYLFILPSVFSILVYAIAASIIWIRFRAPHHLSRSSTSAHLAIAVSGLVLGVAGLLGFGLYVQAELSPMVGGTATIFALNTTGLNLSLTTVSLLFGILVAGCTLMSFAASAHLASLSAGSVQYGEEQLQPACAVLENLLIGVFVASFPSWMGEKKGAVEVLKNLVVGIAILQTVLASTIGAMMFVKEDMIRNMDKRMLSCN